MYRVMTEQEMVSAFDEAISKEQFYVCYQPQVNYNTGMLVGAEALLRWKHPEFGVQFPGDFIPILEKNNYIYETDLFVFEKVCIFIRNAIDAGMNIVPISVNMSRYDIVDHDYVGDIEKIRKKYAVPVKYLRVEITETSAISGKTLMMSVIDKLHVHGYLVEMDDFGSGYSSLNILKDLDLDIIKLDMSFLGDNTGGRGGVIVSAMVQMAKWLNTPVIAEGVENAEQADYMQSLGCSYVQGFFYSKPLPDEEFTEFIKKAETEPISPAIKIAKNMGVGAFWDPKSLETLIFNDFVGAAAIFSYEDGVVRIIRVNKKYLDEVGMNLTESDVVSSDPWINHDKESRKEYESTMLKAIESGEEETCEHWRTVRSQCCGEDLICVRSHVKMVGRSGKQFLMYARIRNITAEKKLYAEVTESENRFRHASEQANVYAWEYDIRKKEMRPCFRCMRDLGLPALVKNYPEPAIEMGIFPPDYADMYREWHKKLEEGVPSLEAVIPLTVGRVPFVVRYTTEFDDNGKPYKAYGSATLVVN
ncbi:MAG: EAL domain-containing protein [Lachnospiraceae bacterium]|nr:EAL domain-containing protein [Lachnospiraceae bacterium]